MTASQITGAFAGGFGFDGGSGGQGVFGDPRSEGGNGASGSNAFGGAIYSAGGSVVSGVVMLSCFGSLTGSMITGPRIFFAMADRGLFFQTIARVSPRFQSPSVAIWLATALGVLYVLFNDFQQLADKFILGIWPFYALAVAAVFVLRRTRPDLPRPYRTWGYPVVPILFLVASVAMVVNALWTDPVNTGITFGIILAGIPVYFAWRAWNGRRGAASAVQEPA